MTASLRGKQLGFLTVLKRDLGHTSKNTFWWCECICGNRLSIRRDKLETKHDCGCFNRELAIKSAEGEPSTIFNTVNKRLLFYYAIKNLFKHVRERDGNKCVYCSKTVNLHVHHILRKSKYSQYIATPENLVTLCEYCHLHIAHSGNTRTINLDMSDYLLTIVYKNSQLYTIPEKVITTSINKVSQLLNLDLVNA